MIKKTFLAVAASLLLTAYASADALDPGSITSVVAGYDNDVYYENVSPGYVEIILSGECEPGQDVDLWVYQDDSLLVKSTTLGCNERVSIRSHDYLTLKVVIENSNHPFPTAYSYSIY